jgi:hypothetical protein
MYHTAINSKAVIPTQSTSHIFMVRPSIFYGNPETATNNFFQRTTAENKTATTQKAQQEFDGLVNVLRAAGVCVYVWQDLENSDTPDAVFPNNWISFHRPRTQILYPMYAPNRRLEIRPQPLHILAELGFQADTKHDFSGYVKKNMFLEGTGALVLDRIHKKAYCALSDRCNKDLVDLFCESMDYKAVVFTAFQTHQNKRLPIYHTNVMMCIGTTFAVVCLDSVDDIDQRNTLLQSLLNDGKDVITISEAQTNAFAGNMMEVCNADGAFFVVMSDTSYNILSANQKKQLEQHVTILHSPLTTIEQLGGGSARCMMAEVFI